VHRATHITLRVGARGTRGVGLVATPASALHYVREPSTEPSMAQTARFNRG